MDILGGNWRKSRLKYRELGRVDTSLNGGGCIVFTCLGKISIVTGKKNTVRGKGESTS